MRILRTSYLRHILRRMAGTLTYVRTDTPVAALTFDDGPHAQFTPRLLDILDQHEAKATFFVIGEAAAQHRDILERMARSGHVIGNHTWDHPSFPLISRMERRAQIRAWEEATAPYGAKLFRPPYGDQSFASRLDLWLSGYQVVTWNIDMQDWRSQSAEELGESLAMNLKPGSILLLHDRLHTSSSGDAFDREAMLRAVEMLLRRFQNQYRFVTVPELMRQGHPNYSSWLQAPDIELRNRSYQQNGHRRLYT